MDAKLHFDFETHTRPLHVHLNVYVCIEKYTLGPHTYTFECVSVY